MKSKKQKAVEAAQRQAVHDDLTLQGKLFKALDRGHMETREAKRLCACMKPHIVDWVVEQHQEEVERSHYG